MNRLLVCFVALFCIGTIVRAAESTPADADRYRIIPRDLVRVAVNGESDVNAERRVDSQGEINVPMLGAVKVAGLTVSETQGLITKRYVQEEIYVRPEVVVTIVEYAPREVMVLGQVTKQGKQAFPPEATSLSIVEAIASAGGLTRIANGEAVRVTRKDDHDREQSFTVDVEKFIEGKAGDSAPFMLQPGDVVFVPERTF
ncbi:MAG TPA: polysaccharide biosynthesis/export family protein [Opitutaceae bacterium]|nr:polysaccharide biosynthesis/export family protein [Opitutaceae bacterium]